MKGWRGIRDCWKLVVIRGASVRLNMLYQRAKYILRSEGWRAFLRQGFSFVRSLFLSYGNYYIYEKNLDPAGEEIKFEPKIDCTPKVIAKPDEFDRIADQGYDFKAMDFRRKLEKGALAFCLFVGQELASVTWVARSKEAKKEIDYLPFKVNFEAGEVCSGASFTDPAYRGRGLLVHTYSYIFRYLASNAILKDRFSIEVSNIASQRAHAKFNPVVTGKGRYLKVFWWEFWREHPPEEPKQ
jgi:hypothetical protein